MKRDGQPESPLRRRQTGTTLRASDELEGRLAQAAAAFGDQNDNLNQRADELRRAAALAADLLAQVSAERLRFRFLAETSALLSASLDYETTLKSLSRILVPTIADGCGIFLATDTAIRCVATTHADPAREPIMLALATGFCRDATDPENLLAQVMRDKRPIVVSGHAIERGAATCMHDDPDALALFSRLSMRWVMAFPFLSRDRVLGAILLYGTTAGRDADAVDGSLVQEIASRAAIAIDNALLYEEARRAISARENLMAIVSHDLRNSLSLALMSASVLDAAALHDERRVRTKERIAGLRKGLGQMRRLIEDLLDFASLEAGHLSLLCEPHDAGMLVEEALAAFHEAALGKSIRLEGHAKEGACKLVCDGDRLLQVLSNLLGNALKFTPAGGLVRLAVTDVDGEVEFSITDTGTGIVPEELPRIFEPYFRSGHRREPGTGLGLFIAKGVVESHGGRMWVESRVGVGTTFRFRIPKESHDGRERMEDDDRSGLVA